MPRNYAQELLAIYDALAESFLEISDEEIHEEAKELGEDIKGRADNLRQRLQATCENFMNESLSEERKPMTKNEQELREWAKRIINVEPCCASSVEGARMVLGILDADTKEIPEEHHDIFVERDNLIDVAHSELTKTP